MHPKKILYISYDGMTDPLGQSQVLPYLKGLSELAYEFHLISFEKSGRFEAGKEEILRICREAGIVWHPLMYTKKPPVLSTWKDLRKMKKLAVKLHREQDFQLVHCRSYISALCGLYFKQNFGLPFLFDMRGFWADERLDGGIWKLKNPLFGLIYSYFKRKEKEFLTNADFVVSLTEAGKKEMLTWQIDELSEDKIRVIPCSVDTERFDPEKIPAEKISALRKELNLTDEKILLYVGSIGTWYLLEEMLNFYRQYHLKYANSHFLFLTKEDPKIILEAAQKLGLPANEISIKSVEYAEMPLYMSIADHAVFFIKPAYSKIASSPVKQGELMSMGIPVVCNSGVGDSESLVRKYRSGVVVNSFTTGNYETALDELSEHTFNSQEIRRGAIAYFSLRDAVNSYASIYSSLTELREKH